MTKQEFILVKDIIKIAIISLKTMFITKKGLQILKGITKPNLVT